MDEVSRLSVAVAEAEAIRAHGLAAAAPAGAAGPARDILAEYVAYRDAEDMPNAIAVYDEMADYLLDRVREDPRWDPGRGRIVSSFMPKSGGTFIHNRLLAPCGFVEYFWGITHPRRPRLAYAVPRALGNYMRGGMACHTHFTPSPHNVAAMDAAGVDRIWVHVRDPRESVVSAYWHYLGIGHGEGDVAVQRVREAAVETSQLGIDVEFGNTAKLNSFVRKHIAWTANWVAQWLAIAQARPGYVVFSTFAELKQPDWMLARVFDEFGITRGWPRLPDAMPADRRRRDREKDWRIGLTPETVACLDEATVAAIGRYQLTAVICPDLQAARAT